MSFNIDDPLAGILSDGSDDSFFDDDILGKKKPPKKKTTPIVEKKNALFDLGDDKPKSIVEKKDTAFNLDIASAKKTGSSVADENKIGSETQFKGTDITKSPSFKRTVSKESIKVPAEPKNKSFLDKLEVIKSPAKSKISSSTDKLNILSDLNDSKKEPTKTLEKGKSSQSLLDDILGGSSIKTGSSSQVTRPTTAAKSQEFDFDSFMVKNDSKQTSAPVANRNIPSKQTTKTETPKEEVKKKPNEDWLGIFQKDVDEDQEDESGMPSWLVGDTKKKKAKETAKKIQEPATKEVSKIEQESHEPEQTEIPKRINENVSVAPQISMPAIPPIAMPRVQASNDDVTAEGAALYMEQQESQLMIALQLKAQEEKLAAMQMRQKEAQRIQREAAQAQHAQVDAILQRQANQRQQMQSIIAAHQERITQRIRDLLGTSSFQNEDDPTVTNNDEVDYTTSDRKESPHMKEKKQLLQLVQSLQENHDKEIDLMETSYRRQLAFLEISINQSEERMKEESEKLVKFYTEKINWLDEHHHLYKTMTEENMASLTERHKAENELLRQQHLENVRVLQEHHSALMENIKNAVKQEQVLIQDSAGFSGDLHELVADVKQNKSQCQQLVEKVEALVHNTQHDTERSLQSRDAQINDMVQQLKKEREYFETEKIESREIVKMLETRLKQMTTMMEEEAASFKQKKMEFEFDKATFAKQTEFAKNVLKKQNEEIKALKEEIEKEYQEKIAKIDEEKAKALKDSAAVAKERASIQNLKLELEKTKAELHAQLEEASEERSKLNLEKQQMHMEEQRILAKTRDLDLLAKTAMEKQTQADKKYSEAEFIQKKYEDRIRRMQEHVVSLNAREKQIAKEKVALSRERLSLHNEKKQLETRQHCSLCKDSQNIPAYNFEPSYNMPDTLLNMPVSRNYSGTGTNLTMNAIEQEMAHFMGRNFGMRHSAEIGNANYEGVFDDRDVRDSAHVTQSTQLESSAFKDYMDPKFMMLRLDVQQVLSNLDQSKKDGDDKTEHESERE